MTGTDDGVSSVVSAVLLFSLLSASFLVWSVTTLPEWISDREDIHLEESRTALAGLQTDLERLSFEGSPGPVAATLALNAPKVPLLQATPSQGALDMDDAFRFQAAFTGAGLHVLDGTVFDTPGTPASGAGPQDVARMETLVVAFTTVGVDNPSDAALLNVTASDDTDSVTVTLGHYGAGHGTADCGNEIRVVTTTAAGGRDQILLCGAGAALTSAYTVDLLEPRLGVVSALADLDAYDITFTSATFGDGSAALVATHAAVWTDSAGQTRVAGSGNPSGFAVDQTGASLTFHPNHRELTPQDLVWEAGGLVVDQPDGEVVAVAPGFALDVDAANGTGMLRWTITTLAGTGSLSGTGTAQASVLHTTSTRAVLDCTGATFTLTGSHGDAWRAFLRDEVQATGAADVTWGGSGDTATLTLGTGTVTQWILDLRIVEATVSLR